MFATIDDLKMRFGTANVMRTANFDSLNELDPATEAALEPRIMWFLQQAHDIVCDTLRQGSYQPEDFTAPYPPVLVNLVCTTAYIRMYRTRHSESEATPDAFAILETENDIVLRNIQGGVIRFDKKIPKALAIPTTVNTSILGTDSEIIPRRGWWHRYGYGIN